MPESSTISYHSCTGMVVCCAEPTYALPDWSPLSPVPNYLFSTRKRLSPSILSTYLPTVLATYRYLPTCQRLNQSFSGPRPLRRAKVCFNLPPPPPTSLSLFLSLSFSQHYDHLDGPKSALTLTPPPSPPPLSRLIPHPHPHPTL